MIYQFRIKDMSEKEKKLMDDFSYYLLDSIKQDILENINADKLLYREKYLLKTPLIKWKSNPPKSINMFALIKLISESFVCTKQKNNLYSIHIDRRIYMPGTRTKIDKIARLIDKGNDKINPTNLISKVIHKYMKNINDYWKSYVESKLHILYVKESIEVK